ncbi:hypothetical protein Salat_2680100 [Sesamum alatum]|uniref:Uncharacterized protein n=1 Tax=Sesamum alatum TaxID=300844 RepID=A0AAE2CB72_9LAMI|nr:hypothetical protein Salat_2680100 [Sesamum alatum]
MAPTPNRRNNNQAVNSAQTQTGPINNLEQQNHPSMILTQAPPSQSIPQSLISQFYTSVQSLQTTPSQSHVATRMTTEPQMRNSPQALSPDSNSNPGMSPSHASNPRGREDGPNSQSNLQSRNNLISLGQYEYIVQPFHVEPHVFNNPPRYTRTIIELNQEREAFGRERELQYRLLVLPLPNTTLHHHHSAMQPRESVLTHNATENGYLSLTFPHQP